jgi:serine protease Do
MNHLKRVAFISLGAFLAFLCTPLSLYAEDGLKESEALRQTSRGFSAIARQTIPAVVAIKVEVESSRSSRSMLPEPFNDDFFKRFFGNPMPHQEPIHAVGFGSGAIISQDGYIITNYHVVKGAEKIEVTLADDSLHIAKLIGSDPDTDLAVVKIEGTNLPFLTFADSDELEIGEWVIAIGAPQSLRSTLTVGVVSAKGRSDLELHTIEEFIQSDVAINPGNSGGPLLNVDGKVVGINSALLSPTGAYIGISFAIPSNIVKMVADQVIASGSVKRGFMGITLKAVTPEIAAAYNLDKTAGIVITDVKKNSAAEKAGLRFADVILEVDGQEIKNAKHLHRLLWIKGPGKRVNLTLNREGTRIQVPVTLEESSYAFLSGKDTFGLEFESEPVEGPGNLSFVIRSVENKSAAEKAGLRAGMKILGINRYKPQSLEEAYGLLKEAYAKGKVLLLVDTGRQSVFVLLENN